MSKKITPINRRIIVRRCVTDHARDENGKVLVYLPDDSYDHSNTCEIIDVSDDCRIFRKEHIGWFIELPEFFNGLDEVNFDLELWSVSEKVLDDTVESGMIFKEG